VNIRDRKPAGSEKPRGIVGLNPLLWGLLVFLFAIVGVPAYFYERPRITRAYSA
jgi:hypothetical protein